MENKVLSRMTVFLVLISLIFSSCSTAAKSASSLPGSIKSVPKASPGNKVESTKSAQKDKQYHIKQKAIESWEDYEATNLPVISAIPEKNIYLYGIKPNGVVLYIGGNGHYFAWDYMTPRFILPQMDVGDYDNDGKDELSIVLYVGSGTGYSVEELHVIDLSEKEFLSEEPSSKDYEVPNPKYFKDNLYKPDDYLKQINRLVDLKTYSRNGTLMGNLRVGKQSYVMSLKDVQSADEKAVVTGASFGDIVRFSAKNKRLSVQMAVGVATNTFATPFFVGDVYADVNFNTGKFTMSNLRFVPEKE